MERTTRTRDDYSPSLQICAVVSGKLELRHPQTHQGARLARQTPTEADPSAIGRVIERLQDSNIVPRRILAESATNDLHIGVDVFGLTEEELSLVAGKIGQGVSVYHAHPPCCTGIG